MNFNITGLSRVFVPFALLLLNACGGGGGVAAPMPLPPPAVTYSVGGTISGLVGSVVLQNNGGDNLTLMANGNFTFATKLSTGAAYNVSVLTQPSGQTCSLISNAGLIAGSDVTGVTATCAATPATYSVGGTLTGLSAGNSLILTNNGTDHLTLSANGGFTFATKLADGAAYNLTLAATTPAAQPCTSTYGAGVITAANVTSLNVICGLAGGLSTFTGTGSVATGRVGHTTTLLPSGKVLVVGGGAGGGIGALADAELYDPTTGLWSATGPLSAARIAHTATLLPSGLVLVSGGFKTGAVTTELASAELYDPATGQWSATGSLVVARNSHTSTLLPNGKVLISGGTGGAASTELYDPATGKWTVSGSLTVARFGGHTATLLPNGKVLVSGGQGAAPIASAELFDPASGTWTATGSLATARLQHTATLLPNGKVLVSGGSGAGSLASAELYDPATGQWSVTGSLGTARDHHTATLLPSGKVLASGGYIGGVIGAPLDSAELYDPTTGNWLVTGSLVTARYTHTATLLLNGKVLLSFGSGALTNYLSSAEVYF